MASSARWMVAAMIALMAMGVVMVAAASATPEALAGRPLGLLRNHTVRVGLALVAFLLALRVRPRWLVAAAWPAWIVSIVLLVAVMFVGDSAKGSQRWLDLGIMSFQPSELARLSVILAIAAWAARNRDHMGRFSIGVAVPFALAGLPALLVFLEPDFGSSVYLLFVAVLVLWVGGARPTHLAGAFFAVMVSASIYGWNRFAHVAGRVEGFTDPAPGSQVWQGLTAMGSGHWTGVGIGRGLGGWGYVPEAENDFILAVIGEELGLLGTLGVLTLYGLFLWHGLKLLLGLRSRFALVVGMGLMFQIIVQALLNIAVVTAMAPPKGLPLPFVSAGGTSLLVLTASTGLLLGLARRPEEDPEVGTDWLSALMQRGRFRSRVSPQLGKLP
jgi:cell division protein FtsW